MLPLQLARTNGINVLYVKFLKCSSGYSKKIGYSLGFKTGKFFYSPQLFKSEKKYSSEFVVARNLRNRPIVGFFEDNKKLYKSKLSTKTHENWPIWSSKDCKECFFTTITDKIWSMIEKLQLRRQQRSSRPGRQRTKEQRQWNKKNNILTLVLLCRNNLIVCL